jgi:hypothetical protein
MAERLAVAADMDVFPTPPFPVLMMSLMILDGIESRYKLSTMEFEMHGMKKK